MLVIFGVQFGSRTPMMAVFARNAKDRQRRPHTESPRHRAHRALAGSPFVRRPRVPCPGQERRRISDANDKSIELVVSVVEDHRLASTTAPGAGTPTSTSPRHDDLL